jgi:hypothetical protein
MWTHVTDPDASNKAPSAPEGAPGAAAADPPPTEKERQGEEAAPSAEARPERRESLAGGPDLDSDAATAALAAGFLTGRAPWMGNAFGHEAAELESVPVPPAQGQLPVQSPTIDRREPQEPRFFDTPIKAASGAILAILQRPYLWPSGGLPGDPGRLVSATTHESLRHVASPPPWRSAGRGRRR